MASSPSFAALGGVESPDAIRRARKRATDRKSQRSHRERQRAYVRNLEQTLESLSAATSNDQRIVSLLSEQEVLRRRCAALESQLARIRSIAGEAGDVPSRSPENDPLDVSNAGDGLDFSIETTSPFLSTNDQLPQSQPTETDDASTLCLPLWPECEVSASWALPTQTLSDSNLGLIPVVATRASPCVSLPAVRGCFRTIPQYSTCRGVSDRQIQSMLNEAIAEHQMNKFDITEPSLIRLLADQPVNVLAFRLFQFIKSYGPMPMHWMLATFWVQYLYLRWNVLGTSESYDMIPNFMKPTPIECAIPHQIFVNMLVWPEVRQALICDPTGADVEEVGTALLQNLSPNWPQTFGITGDMIASMDVYRMIEIQAAQYDFWKVDSIFFQRFPQFKAYNLGQET